MDTQFMVTFAGLLIQPSKFPISCLCGQWPRPSRPHSSFPKSVPLTSFPLKQIFQLGKHARQARLAQRASVWTAMPVSSWTRMGEPLDKDWNRKAWWVQSLKKCRRHCKSCTDSSRSLRLIQNTKGSSYHLKFSFYKRFVWTKIIYWKPEVELRNHHFNPSLGQKVQSTRTWIWLGFDPEAQIQPCLRELAPPVWANEAGF